MDIFEHLHSASEEMHRYIREGLAEVERTVNSGGSVENMSLRTPPQPNRAEIPTPSPPSEHSTKKRDLVSPEVKSKPTSRVTVENKEEETSDSEGIQFSRRMGQLEALGAKYGYMDEVIQAKGDVFTPVSG